MAIDLGQTGAILEYTDVDERHCTGDGYGGQAGLLESTVVHAGHTLRNRNGGQRIASIECPKTNGGYAFGDDCILTALKQRICGSLYKGIAVATRIIDGISLFHYNGFKTIAHLKNPPANTSESLGNSDGGQTSTMPESIVAYAVHAFGDGDGSHAAASKESMISDSGHTVCLAVILYRTWNHNIARVV